MAQGLIVLDKIGQILNPLFGITPRMMSAEDGKLGFTEEDFPGTCRGDMFVISHPDHFASRAIGDFSSENIQHDLFPESFALLEADGDVFVGDEQIFPDEEMMHDPAYVQAWTEFVAEKGLEFADRRMEDVYFSGVAKSPTSQRQQEKILIPLDSERIHRSHGRRGRNRVPSISERVRHHHKALSVLAQAE